MKNEIHYGHHSVMQLLQQRPQAISKIIIAESSGRQLAQIIALATKHKITIERAPRQQLEKLSNEGAHQGVVALCQAMSTYNENDLLTLLERLTTTPLLLILDGVQDPHNLGACLRSAAAAGVDAVIIPKDRAVGLTATARKVACGAAEGVPLIQVTNLARTIQMLQKQNIWIYGASPEAEQCWYQADCTIPLAIVLGAEGGGIRRLTKRHCDELVKIPMHSNMSSINVSAATAICLFEAVRQRAS